MKKLAAYTLVALSCYASTFAQSVNTLKSKLATVQTDTAKVKTLAQLGFEYAFIDLDSSRLFCQQAIQLAEEINDIRGKADATNNLAISYDVEGNHEVSVSYFLSALKLYEKLQARDGMARIYNNCGMAYQSLGDTIKSLDYHKLSLALEEEMGDSLGIAYSMTQVASLHLQMAHYDSAQYFYDTALALLVSLNDTQGLAYAHWGLGELYLYTKQARKALYHSAQSFELFETEENNKGMAETSLIMGKTHMLMQNYAKAEEKLSESLTLSTALDAKNVILEGLLCLSKLHKLTNDYKLALDYHEQFTALQDTVLKSEMASNIKEIESKYHFEKQQQQIAHLNKENAFQSTLKDVFIGVAIVVALLLILLYWAYMAKTSTMEVLKQKNKEIERKNAIIEVEKKNALAAAKAKADFLSVMSHEIRTPMNVVIGSIYLLLEDAPKKHQIENLNMLKFSAENLLTLLNDILDLSKLESGKMELESIPFDLQLLTRGISEGYGAEARKKGIDFSLDIEKGIPNHLVGDPGRLSQVLNNLISNAIKFTEEGGVNVNIKMLKEGRKKIKLKFVIKDTGIGISPDKQKLIFDNFTQADSNTTRKYGGTGLGLSITKQILKLFGSEIKLKSEPGRGSRFAFKLSFITSAVPVESKVSDF